MSGVKHKLNNLTMPARKKIKTKKLYELKPITYSNIQEFPNLIIYKVISFLNCLSRVFLLRTNKFWNQRIGEVGIKVYSKLSFGVYDTALTIFGKRTDYNGNKLIQTLQYFKSIVILPKLTFTNIMFNFMIFNYFYCNLISKFLEKHSAEYKLVEIQYLYTYNLGVKTKERLYNFFLLIKKKCMNDITLTLCQCGMESSLLSLMKLGGSIICEDCEIDIDFWNTIPKKMFLLKLINNRMVDSKISTTDFSIETLHLKCHYSEVSNHDIYKTLIANTTKEITIDCCEYLLQQCLPDNMNEYKSVSLPLHLLKLFFTKYKHQLKELYVILKKNQSLGDVLDNIITKVDNVYFIQK